MTITQGIQAPGLAFRDSTTDEDVSVTELRQAVDQTSQNTSDISAINSELLEKSSFVENRFKGNQNWNVVGSTGDPLPSATPTTYNIGSEVVAGVEVITANAVNLTLVNGVISADSGVLRRRYTKDPAGLITKNSQYAGVKLTDNSQLQALVDDILTNGVQITENGNDVVVDIDLSTVTGGFRFFGLSNELGVWADINDDESISYYNLLINNQFVTLVNDIADAGPNDNAVVSAEVPATIGVNSVLTLTNPFGANTPVSVVVEIFANSRWSAIDNSLQTSSTSGLGGYYVEGVGIVIQTAITQLIQASNLTLGGHNTTTTLTSAPLRVRVSKIK